MYEGSTIHYKVQSMHMFFQLRYYFPWTSLFKRLERLHFHLLPHVDVGSKCVAKIGWQRIKVDHVQESERNTCVLGTSPAVHLLVAAAHHQ